MTSTMRFDRWEKPDASQSVSFDQLAGGTGLVPIAPTSVTPVGAGSSASYDSVSGLITFASCTSININGVFSNEYSKYQIYLTGINPSTSQSINFRLRAGSTDSSTLYYTQLLDVQSGAVSGGNIQNGDSFAAGIANSGHPNAAHSTYLVQNPAASLWTNYFMSSFGITNTASYLRLVSGYHAVASAYTGFTLIATAGNTSATLQIFGLKQ